MMSETTKMFVIDNMIYFLEKRIDCLRIIILLRIIKVMITMKYCYDFVFTWRISLKKHQRKQTVNEDRNISDNYHKSLILKTSIDQYPELNIANNTLNTIIVMMIIIIIMIIITIIIIIILFSMLFMCFFISTSFVLLAFNDSAATYFF